MNAEYNRATGNGQLTLDKYFTLLESAAAEYNNANRRKLRKSAAVNQHFYDIHPDIAVAPSDDHDTINIDTNVEDVTYSINRTMQSQRPRPYFPPAMYNSLPTDVKEYLKSGKVVDHRPRSRSPGSRFSPTDVRPKPGTGPLARQANAHDTQPTPEPPPTPEPTPSDEATSTGDSALLDHITGTNVLAPNDLRHVMSHTLAQATDDYNNNVNLRFCNHNVQYRVTQNELQDQKVALVDRGANGGLAGDDMLCLSKASPERFADITGIDNHGVQGLPIVTAAGLIATHRGPVIGIFNQYALLNRGKSIHGAVQLEHQGHDVNDLSLIHI